MLFATATLIFLPTMTGMAQQAPLRRVEGAAVEGTVLSSTGKPVDDASVTLEAATLRNPAETRTNAAGRFKFSALPAGSYAVSAQKSGVHTRTALAISLADGDRKHLDLILELPGSQPSSPAAQPMGFSDQPSFTVAGVTDWTAVGGHGSDSILRTSEDLARETLTLRAQGAGHAATLQPQRDGESESKLQAALVTAPGSFAANHQLGEFYLQAGRDHESLPLLEAAYRIDPANDGNEHDLALAYEQTGDLKQAREHIQNMLNRKNTADLHRAAGELDEKMSNPLPAVKEYQQAVSLDPSEQNYFAWGSELLLHRAVWQATEVFRDGAKAYPKSVRLLTALGSALFAGAVYDEAAQSFCAASDLDPGDTEPYIFMGKVEMAAPMPLPCVEAKLARFVQQKPDDSLANYLYAMSIWKRQVVSANKSAMPQVEALLTKAVSLDSKCFDGYLQLGILAASRRDYANAIALYTKAIDVDPQLAEAHYRLGVAYERIGEQDKAKREFRLHDEIETRQAATVERERQQVKQFVVVEGQPANSVPQ
jgi:tetratricopeptide (TPR) repeat protein